MMNATENRAGEGIPLANTIQAACSRIAPNWPLDRMIAVNPLWGSTAMSLPDAAAELAALSGSRLAMPRDWYREQWRSGRVTRDHLAQAIDEEGAACTPEQLVAAVEDGTPAIRALPLITDAVDATTDGVHQMSWRDFVLHNLSQICAAYFDDGQAQIQPDRRGGLYGTWRRYVRKDFSPRFLMRLRGYRAASRELPADAETAIAVMLDELAVPAALRERYLAALLHSINGWASWCAYLKWQGDLAGDGNDHMVQLLAMRLGWEWLLHRCVEAPGLEMRWQAALGGWENRSPASGESQTSDWLWQRALEIAYQGPLCEQLAAATTPRPSPAPIAVQAAFCIDVRSEVFRRAFESASPEVATLGFAGFFGLPVDYLALGAGDARPQLPGLLAPALRVSDTCEGRDTGVLSARRHARLDARDRLKQFRSGPLSTFPFVETGGPLYALKLLGQSFGRGRPEPMAQRAGLSRSEARAVRPRLTTDTAGAPIDAGARVALAEGVLRAMSLTRDFAPLVLLAGHGSETVNNPHAAGYDCGACCGQTGEVNARALADLLNDSEVRRGLARQGIHIPDGTHFLPGLHNTTTDQVMLFDLDLVPDALGGAVANLESWLAEAGRRARRERSARLGLAGLDDEDLAAAVGTRARDWSEVRPEWGLAGNAAFIVAPRERTAGMDLAGRSFLHDYRWEDDDGFGVLELIMTAPMIVTHWINMQYYASTVDNRRFGSGNKMLHNVVGARIGVFEGNGGDLRIGLPLQSLHDGEDWVHDPLRLSVFIEAPAEPIEAIIAKHECVKNLVDNDWLFLFRVDAGSGAVEKRVKGSWVRASGGTTTARVSGG